MKSLQNEICASINEITRLGFFDETKLRRVLPEMDWKDIEDLNQTLHEIINRIKDIANE